MIAELPRLFGSEIERRMLSDAAEGYVERAKTMMRRAHALVSADRIDTIQLLTARRNALALHFQSYQRLKHTAIFDPVVEHAPTSSKIVARTMKLDCMELGEAFSAYHTRWLGIIPAEWRYYRRDMLEIVDVLVPHLDAELRAMRQLIMISNFYRS